MGGKAMTADTEIKMLGIEILNQHLGVVETERFIALIQREKFDYTKWRENLFAGISGEEISKRAMEFQKHQKNAS
jgi:hypothetical protein